MKMRPIHLICTFVGVVVLSMLAWLVFTPRDMQPVVRYKITPIDIPKTAETAAARSSSAATAVDGYRGSHRTPHQDRHADEPETEINRQERLKAAMESPAYAAYTQKQAERLGFNIVLWWEFLEAAGITHNGRELQAEAFQKHFPDGGEYADYEPMMRLAVAEMFLEDPSRSVMDVLQRFNATQSNRVWRFGYFNGYEGEYEWGQRIQRDAADIVATAARRQDTFEVLSPRDPQPPETETFLTDGISETSASGTGPPNAPQAEIPAFADLERVPETLKALETQFLEQFSADISESPTDADVETALRERFSRQRFGSAVETLRRYGPEEGLRRLRASDPEVASHIERFLRRDDTTAD